MNRIRILLLLLANGAIGNAAIAEADSRFTRDWSDANLPELIGLYQHLHTNPELSFREEQTSRRVAEELRKAGAEVTTGVGKLGVVGVLKNGEGPTILVRSDMDGLPVKEETGLAYASKATATDAEGKTVGVMHACGHDIHMTCLVGTAKWFATHKELWNGTLLFIGQPAEEMIGGAKAMLADGLYERFPKPDAALALHVAHDLPAGSVAYTSGPALAGSTSVNVTIRGKGGHGAAPHSTVDPIFLAALFVIDLQSVVSREVDPVQPCVISVGSIHGGTKSNIIPNEVKLQLTLRAYRHDVREQLIEGIKRRIKGLALAHRAPEPGFEIAETTDPTVNTPTLVTRILPALRKELGDGNVVQVDPVMGAEDFGLFSKGGVPTFMFRLGTIPPAKITAAIAKNEVLPSLHSASYFPDPGPSIETGIRAMTSAVLQLMAK